MNGKRGKRHGNIEHNCELCDSRREKGESLSEFAALFPDSFSFEIYSVISMILKLGAITDARKVETMNEPGEVYEFLFVYRSRRMYSKVNLCEGKVSVLVYSAHLQRLGNIEDGKFA